MEMGTEDVESDPNPTHCHLEVVHGRMDHKVIVLVWTINAHVGGNGGRWIMEKIVDGCANMKLGDGIISTQIKPPCFNSTMINVSWSWIKYYYSRMSCKGGIGVFLEAPTELKLKKKIKKNTHLPGT